VKSLLPALLIRTLAFISFLLISIPTPSSPSDATRKLAKARETMAPLVRPCSVLCTRPCKLTSSTCSTCSTYGQATSRLD
jgi:zona occludens toxin (predicted ATPase)